MKPDAVLINTSRGGIISEVNLYEVMESNHLSGAQLMYLKKSLTKAL